ncbi:MAG TPA: NAD-dependent malic enzyme [Peptococcaceae bacterium]|nr:MAG: NADP-dependent malic enzyme (Conversion of malate into pyruvate) [Clostridia bacterium 41_269]HBT19987.1 NAD-dependent malic enzyme [Peptococcaceae bacterium]
MSLRERALKLHREKKGKIAVKSKIELKTMEDLTLAYTPGVAEPCKEIFNDPEKVYEYTGKGNAVAVVTNGSAVLGLGDIGPKASLPVMEGKCVLFKTLADIDAYPILLDSKDVEEIINTIKIISPGFGGINLEDIKAPLCFEIEEKLKSQLDIPVFHDDQHGTAIVVLAALTNGLKVVGKELQDCKIVINGAGAAGLAVAKLLLNLNVKDIKVCDLEGVLYPGSPQCTYPLREEIAIKTNPRGQKGSLKEVIEGADIFIGLSGPNVLNAEMVSSMAKDPIIMALANPVPEIMPEEAIKGGAKVVFTGRSDFPNQVNNVSAFPGVFRGALDVKAKEINEKMKIAAAYALAELVSPNELREDFAVASVLDPRVVPSVAKAVAKAAVETNVARLDIDPESLYK